MSLEEADLVIENCRILPMTNSKAFSRGLIATKGGAITFVGDVNEAPKIEAEKVIEGRGKLAIPGLVNCHTHIAMTLFRGLAEDMTLQKWLREAIWPLEEKLTPRDVYAGALLGCLEMIKNGVTCFGDMYFFESEVAEATKKAGLRAVLAGGIIEAGASGRGEKLLKDAFAFAERYNGYAEGRITASFGPHTVFTCSKELLTRILERSLHTNVGIHIHIAESKEMADKIRTETGHTEVELLEELEFLNDNVLAAHCIHITSSDIRILARRGVKVAYNPVSNMKLAQGVARVKELTEMGITVGIGTDGAASNNSLDMFDTLKAAALLQKTKYRDPTVFPCKQALESATISGSAALGMENRVGTLEVGKRADIVLVDLKKPNLTPLHNLYATLVYSAHGSDVDSTIVDGEIIMENREVKTLDEEEVMEEAQACAFDLPGR